MRCSTPLLLHCGKTGFSLSARILTLQGDGDHAGARAFLDQYGKVGPELQADLDRIAQTDIPVDIVFKQGREVLGLHQAGPKGTAWIGA